MKERRDLREHAVLLGIESEPPHEGTVAVSKHAWLIWLAPAAVWAIYMCWLSGYRSGFEQGHQHAWDSAQQAFNSIDKPLPSHYQWLAQRPDAAGPHAP